MRGQTDGSIRVSRLMYLAFSEPLGTDEYERITVADHIGTGVDVRDRRTAQILEGLRREDEERATLGERERARACACAREKSAREKERGCGCR